MIIFLIITLLIIILIITILALLINYFKKDNFNNNNKIMILTTKGILNFATMLKYHIESFNIKCEIIYKLNKKCKYSDDIYFILVYDRKINKNIIPKFFIWYQIEQFNTSISLIPKFDKFTYNLMNKALFVCDFDENNINKYKNNINNNIYYFPSPFYYDNNDYNNIKKEYDIVFFGAINERRKKILDNIKKNKIEIKILTGKFNNELDYYLLRSKYCINIHFYEDSELESDRINICLKNNCCIISESCLNDSNSKIIYNNTVNYFDIIKNNTNFEINSMISKIKNYLDNYEINFIKMLENKKKIYNNSKFYTHKILFNINNSMINNDFNIKLPIKFYL